MTTLNGLANRMRLQASSVNVKSQELTRKVSLAVGNALIYSTPVDTSRARMNWQTSIGVPKTGVLSQYPARPSSSNEGVQVALRSLRSAVGEYSGQRNGVFIVNNLDYIGKLNDGWSSQAPADFVAKAVMAGAKAVSTVKLLIP